MSEDLIAEMQFIIDEAAFGMKARLYCLAAQIMRECDQPGMAGDIDQIHYRLARQAQDNRKESALAQSVVTGIRHDAEVLRKEGRRARIDECQKLRNIMNERGMSLGEVRLLASQRIRELEAEEE